MALLTVEHTLADIATFIRFVREYVGNLEYSKVILWGSGHGGSLAVWARKRFPHLVTAAWASSGPFYLSEYSYSMYTYFSTLIYGTFLKLNHVVDL